MSFGMDGSLNLMAVAFGAERGALGMLLSMLLVFKLSLDGVLGK